VDGKIFNSRGVLLAIVIGPAIFDLKGKKLYDLKGVNIYSFPESWLDICQMLKAPRGIWTNRRIGCFRHPDPAELPSPRGGFRT
jgi:hypothetical protein